MRNFIAAITTVLTFALTGAIQAGEPSVQGRIGVTGINVPLKPGEVAGCGGRITNAIWQKDPAKVKLYVTAYFTATSEWQRARMSFTPGADGNIELCLMGAFNADGTQTWTLINDLQVEGVVLKNADFADGLKNWRVPRKGNLQATLSEVVKESGKSIRVSHNYYASQRVAVKAGVPVAIGFWFRAAELR